MEDEVISFWCFEHLMKTKEQNFFINSEGMENQLNQLRGLLKILDRDLYFYLESKEATNLYFCFRWLLVIFKREFEFQQILRLWESLFTDYLGSNFHLFIAYGILTLHRDKILGEEMSFDEVLKYCIDLSGHLDLDEVMFQAEKSFLHYQAIEKEVKK
jgi:TBC1 domain family member 15